jgi:hypothetical protein
LAVSAGHVPTPWSQFTRRDSGAIIVGASASGVGHDDGGEHRRQRRNSSGKVMEAGAHRCVGSTVRGGTRAGVVAFDGGRGSLVGSDGALCREEGKGVRGYQSIEEERGVRNQLTRGEARWQRLPIL